MLVTSIPLTSGAITTDHITLTMDALKASAYPDDWYWCGGDPYKSIPQSGCGRSTTCYCNQFNSAFQCHGFALIMAHRTVGSYPALRLNQYKHGAKSNGWQCYTMSGIGMAALCSMGLRPGDIVRASGKSDYSDGHTAIVWKVENGKVYFAESWGSVYSKINWGAFNAAYTSMQEICTGYSYVALWREPTVQQGSADCPHSYKESYEASHPHRKYSSCVYCNKTEYTGEFQHVENCICCNGTHSYVYANEDIHPHRETKTCSMCGYFTYSGNTTTVNGCPVCLGVPYDMKAGFEKKTYNVGEQLVLEFKAENAVKYNVTVKKDGKNVSLLTDTTNTSLTIESAEAGTYIANITAFSKDGRALNVNTQSAIVKAPVTDVEVLSDKYLLTYTLSVSRELAQQLCTVRGLTLEEYGDGYFKASFAADTDSPDSEYIDGDLYAYIPGSLPYHEAADFCRAMGGVLASAENAQIEAAMVEFCDGKTTDGIMLGANDEASEGIWLTEESRAIEYFNWNISYEGTQDYFKNYMFMFPGGSMTDSYAVSGYDHGFVLKIYDPFTYIENDDGTLTLKRVKAVTSANLLLPAYHEGKAVTAIATDAFANGSYGEIIIPETITNISQLAFSFANIEGLAVYRNSAAYDIISQQFDDIPLRVILPFEDVSRNAWYYSGIEYCYARSYISGISEVQFAPSANLTREQFVMILSGLAGADLQTYTNAQTGMSDVPVGRWYSSAVAWAVSEGYVSGVAPGVFGLGQNITREQIARLFYLYAEKIGVDVTGRAELTLYEDAEAVSEWAYENLSWAVDYGLISGMSPTTLSPRGPATRAQAARIFMIFDTNNTSQK